MMSSLERPAPARAAEASDDEGITQILNRALAGNAQARERVYALLYAELLRLARTHLSGSNAASLNPSVLVHEAYLRMLGRDATPMRDRRAFFAYASTAMRSVLVDHVRAGAAEKRGGLFTPVTLTTGVLESVAAAEDFSRLDEALGALRSVDERGARVVEMRYFAGMTELEVAAALGIAVRTVARDWEKARLFLHATLR
jgi:RNA polymerase sigma factor (TIGR02999 family)